MVSQGERFPLGIFKEAGYWEHTKIIYPSQDIFNDYHISMRAYYFL